VTKYPRKPTAVPPPRPKTKLPAPSKRRAPTKGSDEPARPRPAPAARPKTEPVRAARAVSELELDIELDIEPAAEEVDAADEIDAALDALERPEPGGIEAGAGRGAAAPERRAISVAEDQLVEVQELAEEPEPIEESGPVEAPGPAEESGPAEEPEPAEIPALAIAVHEEPAALATVQSAIATAGHATAGAGTGKDGLERVRQALLEDVDVLLIGLPGGEPLIDAARSLGPHRPIVIAAVTGSAVDGVRRAAEAGADLVATRPHDADRLAPVLLAAARLAAERRRTAAARGAEERLQARIDALTESEAGSLQPFERFQRVLELELKRARRYGYPLSVALFALDIPPPAPPPGVRGILRARSGNALIHSIRDIDLATALPLDLTRAYDSAPATDERFLVLLPYTDLGGAALLARRVITAVAEGPPVVAGGRTFTPRFIGAVAGAPPGQPLSFSRLMKDATRALEQARRDGAELAVPMPPPPSGGP